MTITSAFNSALSGLTATRFATSLVSENIANALTPGYARRTLALSNGGDSTPGVRVDGVRRHADPLLIANRRGADAGHGYAQTTHAFLAGVADLVGTPGETGSLSDRLARFHASLGQAASRPDSATRLQSVATSAGDLVTAIAAASDGVLEMRRRADAGISDMADRMNRSLEQVEALNARIVANRAAGIETAGLQDRRRVLIDDINRMVPLRVIERDSGQVALYAEGGTILLDGSAARLGFARTPNLMPHMTQENGLLSGLTVNGLAIDTGPAGGLRGGVLAAQFELRDRHATAAQADLDAFARDLVERFQDPAVDPTLAPGDAGLFTDAGLAFDPADETGLSRRLALNPAVDPAAGGEVRRLRDGLQSAAPGAVGDATLLQAMSAALDASRVAGSGTFAAGPQTSATLLSGLVSGVASRDSDAARELSFAASGLSEMKRLELSDGVDTDAELQTLMLMEKAYEANARVMQTLDDLMETLLRI